MESPSEPKRLHREATAYSRAQLIVDASGGKGPSAGRFAEATTVISPIEPIYRSVPHSVASPREYPLPESGLDYIFPEPFGKPVQTGQPAQEDLPLRKPKSSIKDGLHSPNTASSGLDTSGPYKEQLFDEAEKRVDVNQRKDIKAAMTGRVAKLFLRGVNFTCSLIVLSMLAATFSIFNGTKSLPPVNNIPPWAQSTNPWPQVVLLVIACISLFMCIVVFYSHFRGGYRVKALVAYSTPLAVAFFTFSVVMWAVGATLLIRSKANGDGHDIWGWSCANNSQRPVFQSDIAYGLICHYQNWSFVCCIIEIIVEMLTIFVYGIIGYRLYSMRRLNKSIAVRDRARTDLYTTREDPQPAANVNGTTTTNRQHLQTDQSNTNETDGASVPPASMDIIPRKEKPETSHMGYSGGVSDEKRYSTIAIPQPYSRL